MSEPEFVPCAKINVKTAYEKIFGPMPDQEFRKLKESIEKVGQLYPIVVNQRYEVIDGHKRLRACREIGIDVLIVVREFEDEQEERRWMHISNLNRMQLTDFARIEAVYNDESFVREEARRRQLSGLKKGSNPPLARNPTDGEKGRTDQILADWAGVSRDMYVRTRKLLLKGLIPAEVKADLRSGKADLKQVLRTFKKTTDEKTEIHAFSGEFYIITDEISMIRGSFKEIDESHIREEGIDLIIPSTDCSYQRKLTNDLALFAARFLNEGGLLVLFAKHAAIGTIANAVKRNARDLELVCVFPEHFLGWIATDKKNPHAISADALYLIFRKRDQTREESNPRQIYEFVEALSIDEDFPNHNPDGYITPRDANPYMVNYLIEQLGLADKSCLICDPVCQFGEAGVKVAQLELAFLGIEEDPVKFMAAKATIEKHANELEQESLDEEAEDEESVSAEPEENLDNVEEEMVEVSDRESNVQEKEGQDLSDLGD